MEIIGKVIDSAKHENFILMVTSILLNLTSPWKTSVASAVVKI